MFIFKNFSYHYFFLITLQRTLHKLNKKNICSEIEYSDLDPKGSKIARLYGTPKILKSFSPGSIPP